VVTHLYIAFAAVRLDSWVVDFDQSLRKEERVGEREGGGGGGLAGMKQTGVRLKKRQKTGAGRMGR
jgi:hypothetical protein